MEPLRWRIVRPGVVVLAGLPGAGKSTLAKGLVARLPEARVIDKDEVRHALFAPCDYSAAERDVTFAAMLDAAATTWAGARGDLRRPHLLPPQRGDRGRGDGGRGQRLLRRHRLRRAHRGGHRTGELAAAGGTHPAADRDADLVRRAAAEMEEPDGDYLTLRMTEEIDSLVDLALTYVEEAAG